MTMLTYLKGCPFYLEKSEVSTAEILTGIQRQCKIIILAQSDLPG